MNSLLMTLGVLILRKAFCASEKNSSTAIKSRVPDVPSEVFLRFQHQDPYKPAVQETRSARQSCIGSSTERVKNACVKLQGDRYD